MTSRKAMATLIAGSQRFAPQGTKSPPAAPADSDRGQGVASRGVASESVFRAVNTLTGRRADTFASAQGTVCTAAGV